jgi:hypothetical protein
MNICFVANYNKTYFFNEVAKRISSKSDVYWIAVNKKIAEYLIALYGEPNVLYLPKRIARLSPGEPFDDFKINELIAGDRILRLDYEEGYKYLCNIQKHIVEFITDKKIKLIFGELTWAHELLIKRISLKNEKLGCNYINPHTVRIPNGRFAFFKDEFQCQLVDLGLETKKFPDDLFVPKKPDYLRLNDQILKKKSSILGRAQRFKRFLTGENLDKDDPTLPKRMSWSRIAIPFKEEINRIMYQFVERQPIKSVENKKFVLFTLHKQPEASVDVLGRYTENQYQIIYDIWRTLPFDWWLVVKEHSNAVGDRGYNFYQNIRKLRNVILIDERIDSYQLLNRAQGVISISGTIGYEAALLNIKALMLADVFFKFSHVKTLTYSDLKYCQNLEDLLQRLPNNEVSDNKIKEFIFQNSFPGLISDPISDSRCMSEDNVKTVAQAFDSIIEFYAKR